MDLCCTTESVKIVFNFFDLCTRSCPATIFFSCVFILRSPVEKAQLTNQPKRYPQVLGLAFNADFVSSLDQSDAFFEALSTLESNAAPAADTRGPPPLLNPPLPRLWCERCRQPTPFTTF